MAVVLVFVLLFQLIWGHTQRVRFRTALWRPLLPVARDSTLRAALLALALQAESGLAYLAVAVLGALAADALGAPWLALAVVALAGLLYWPVITMAVPDKSTYYAEVRAALAAAGATPAQQRAAAWTGGAAALFWGLPLALTTPAVLALAP
ncbi:hypothetical protein EDD29_4169 [Actinocorallia herbida]|uniref:Uncharacterized protein n=1 Tax=Actinocorallia herbida TaxID=58109 RepID=A0A3N1CZD7_9ACTN|nr:hypothetical protein [Actinocorallia herbida]ROO86596.1 hypothetical protein EDD29_4169 [Actinocorallia herbida]